MIAGVCGGIAEYYNIDPTVVRLIAVLSIFLSGFGILAYIILTIVVPRENSISKEPRDTIRENVEEIKNNASQLGEEFRSSFSKEQSPVIATDKMNSSGLRILGIFLAVFGGLFLLSNLFNAFSWFHWGVFWPLILVAIGVLIIIGNTRR
jgi:phage shock protein PspC (stress-responsive transcriptional regulator)